MISEPICFLPKLYFKMYLFYHLYIIIFMENNHFVIATEPFQYELKQEGHQFRYQVCSLLPAFKESFVALINANDQRNNIQFLVHFDRLGNNHWKSFSVRFTELKMVTDSKILLINPVRVELFCLQTGKRFQIVPKMKRYISMEINIFEETGYVCIA